MFENAVTDLKRMVERVLHLARAEDDLAVPDEQQGAVAQVGEEEGGVI